MSESPLDFTSDEGSSVCSPVQFTMSSSDENNYCSAEQQLSQLSKLCWSKTTRKQPNCIVMHFTAQVAFLR